MSSEIALQVSHVTKKMGSKTIVEDLTFEVRAGEVFGFLGPNGAGKTTTLRMIVGLIGITEGNVLIRGTDVTTDFEQAMKHVGAIIENPEMYKFLSGYKNLLHYAKMIPGVTKERIEEVISLVGLERLIHEKVQTYSLGMRQRLGVAQALLHKPSLLILDEPTNGLDPVGIRELRDQLRQLAEKEGVAVLVSSHLLSEMELMCDRVAIIQQGRLVSVQSLQEMIGTHGQLVVRFEVDRLDLVEPILMEFLGHGNLKTHQDRVEIKLLREQIPELNRRFVQAGVSVYMIQPVVHTLEDQFLELTRGGDIV